MHLLDQGIGFGKLAQQRQVFFFPNHPQATGRPGPEHAGIRILGVVLNDIDFEGKDSYYYSYYYYQNRYYSSHYRTKTDAKAQDKGKLPPPSQPVKNA